MNRLHVTVTKNGEILSWHIEADISAPMTGECRLAQNGDPEAFGYALIAAFIQWSALQKPKS